MPYQSVPRSRDSNASTIAATVWSFMNAMYSSGTPPQTPIVSAPPWLWSLWTTTLSAGSAPPVASSTALRMSIRP